MFKAKQNFCGKKAIDLKTFSFSLIVWIISLINEEYKQKNFTFPSFSRFCCLDNLRVLHCYSKNKVDILQPNGVAEGFNLI